MEIWKTVNFIHLEKIMGLSGGPIHTVQGAQFSHIFRCVPRRGRSFLEPGRLRLLESDVSLLSFLFFFEPVHQQAKRTCLIPAILQRAWIPLF